MKTRRILAVLLAALMLLGAFPLALISVGADGATAGNAPAKLPDGSDYYNVEISEGFVVSAAKSTANAWWADGKHTTVADKKTWVGSEGLMFKFDGTGVSGTDPFNIDIELAIYSDNGNTYLLSDPLLARAHGGKAVDGSKVSSTWYISTDGKTWTTVTHQWEDKYGVTAPLTAERTAGYVFIPLDQFWSKPVKKGETTVDETMKNGTDTLAALSAGGKVVTLGDVKVRAEKSANDPAFSMSEIGFVYKGTAPEVGEAGLPAELPNVSGAYHIAQITKDYAITGAELSAGDWWLASSTGLDNKIVVKDRLSWSNSKGLLFRIDGADVTTAGGFNLGIELSISSTVGNTYLVSHPSLARAHGGVNPAGANLTSTWYYSLDGKTWSSVTHSNTDKATTVALMGTHSDCYVFIPLEQFWGKFLSTDSTKTILSATDAIAALSAGGAELKFGDMKIRVNGAAKDAAFKISELGFAYPGEASSEPEKPTGAQSAPDTLPTTGQGYTGAIIDPDFRIYGNENVKDDNKSPAWSGQWYAGYLPNKFDITAIGKEWKHAEGFMFKFDTSHAAAGTDLFSLLVEFSIASGKGSTYLLSDPNMVTAYGKTELGVDRRLPASVMKTASSTWYYSLDGKTWQSTTRSVADKSSQNVVAITAERTTGYVFIPLDQFWSYGISGDHNGMTAFDAINILGEDAKIGDMKIRLASNGVSTDANTVISEFRFVYSSAYLFDESVSLNEGMDWNIFANVPAGYKNAAMTFTMNGKTVNAVAEALSGTVVKYTLTGVGYADIATPITATWTAKDANGQTVTQSYTSTLANYLRKIYGENHAAVCRELVGSMIHYGAALQKLAGKTTGLCNEGIDPPSLSQDSAKLRFTTYINPNESIWESVELAIVDGKTYIKVKVNPPADGGYTHVRFQTAGRISTAEIVGGYAMIPVFGYEMQDTIALNYYKRGRANSENTAGISFNYLFKAAATGDISVDQKAAYDALATLANEQRIYKR